MPTPAIGDIVRYAHSSAGPEVPAIVVEIDSSSPNLGLTIFTATLGVMTVHNVPYDATTKKQHTWHYPSDQAGTAEG